MGWRFYWAGLGPTNKLTQGDGITTEYGPSLIEIVRRLFLTNKISGSSLFNNKNHGSVSSILLLVNPIRTGTN